jgi:hypothetical protein
MCVWSRFLTLYTGQCDRRKNASYPVTTEIKIILTKVNRIVELIMFKYRPTPFFPAATDKAYWMRNYSQYYISKSNENINKKNIEELYQWLYSPLLGFGPPFFTFLISYTIGRTPWAGYPPVARPLLTQGQHKHSINTHRHLCSERGSNPLSKRSSEIARLLWSSTNKNKIQHFGFLEYNNYVWIKIALIKGTIQFLNIFSRMNQFYNNITKTADTINTVLPNKWCHYIRISWKRITNLYVKDNWFASTWQNSFKLKRQVSCSSE